MWEIWQCRKCTRAHFRFHITVVFAYPRFGWDVAWEVNPLFVLWQHLAEQLDLNLSALEYMMKCYPEIKEKEEMRKIVGRYGLTGQQQVCRFHPCAVILSDPCLNSWLSCFIHVWTAILSHPCGNRYIVWCLLRLYCDKKIGPSDLNCLKMLRWKGYEGIFFSPNIKV